MAEDYRTEAEKAYACLTDDERKHLLRRVFETLEYDSDGNPGVRWSSDTTQALGETFESFGVSFTPPD